VQSENGDRSKPAIAVVAALPNVSTHQRSTSNSSVLSIDQPTPSSSTASHSHAQVHLALMYSNPLVTRDPATGSYIPLEPLYVK